MKARIPSALSWVEPTIPNAAVSKSNPAESGMSHAARRHAFARAIAAGPLSPDFLAEGLVSAQRGAPGGARINQPDPPPRPPADPAPRVKHPPRPPRAPRGPEP